MWQNKKALSCDRAFNSVFFYVIARPKAEAIFSICNPQSEIGNPLSFLQNLIENAIKYSNENGKIFISLVEKKDSFEVSVKDRGIGISEEGKKKVFEKFYRDTIAQKKEAMGSGIGLFTAKQIIEKHSGKIWFESKEKEGSTFFFTIPIGK